MISTLHPLDRNSELVANYQKFKNEIDFTAISFPVRLDDNPKFGYQWLSVRENGKQVYPTLYTKRRDMEHITDLSKIKMEKKISGNINSIL